MKLTTIGDLTQIFRSRQQHTQLKQQMDRLTSELASGQAVDPTRQLSGNFGHLSDIEHDLVAMKSYRSATTEAGIMTATMQSALTNVYNLTNELGEIALIASTSPNDVSLNAVAKQGRGALNSIVSAMNTEVAGRYLFSGTDVEATPLESADTLLTEVRTALVGVTSAADVLTTLDTFFNTPGGAFETLIYQGGTSFLTPYQLGEGESVQLEIRADDDAMRNVLKNTVMAALADDTSLSLNNTERVTLARQSGERLIGYQSELVGIRSDLGFAQSRIEQSATRISAEYASLEFARGELLGVDQFQTATELESVQVQLETLYTLTARASRLSLVNFL